MVIIGLIIGGVLVGQDLISAAAVRSQISQIEKYQTAVRTFQVKYGYLPGDMPDPYASQFGFISRGTAVGTGDGDGRILGKGSIGNIQSAGETAVLWRDLSQAGLIEGIFNTATETTSSGVDITLTSTPAISAYLPEAKIGNANYIYAWNAYWSGTTAVPALDSSKNYFGISAAYIIDTTIGEKLRSKPGLTVQQAYAMDKKLDDGLPYSGNIWAIYIDWDPFYLDRDNTVSAYYRSFYTTAVPATKTSCTDNGGLGGTQNYSIKSASNKLNCALSVRF